jgi:hypothetical protein
LAGYRVLGSSAPISFVIRIERSVALMLLPIFTLPASDVSRIDADGVAACLSVSLSPEHDEELVTLCNRPTTCHGCYTHPLGGLRLRPAQGV